MLWGKFQLAHEIAWGLFYCMCLLEKLLLKNIRHNRQIAYFKKKTIIKNKWPRGPLLT